MTVPRLQGEPPSSLTSPLLAEAGLPHVFTTRHFPGAPAPMDPPSPFGPDALALLSHHGLDHVPPAFLKQVHGAAVVEAFRGGRAGVGDILVTDRPGLPLAIFSADCLAITIYDPDRRRLAMAHAGWRGTAQSVAAAAAGALVAAGGRADGFVAAVGPSIGPCCYEVDRRVIDRLKAAFPGRWEAWVRPVGRERWMLDLWAANVEQLRAVGLRSDRIDNPRLCTGCRLDLFFSYRRGGGRGRQVAVAAIPA